MGREVLVGDRFGRLTVLSFAGRNKNRNATWLCKCDCGNEINVMHSQLTSGMTKSCGCLQKERASKINFKHGKRRTRIYSVWCGMKQRCFNKNSKAYKDYGGRGITVCNEWKDDFQAFYNWAYANGYDENAPRGQCTIERINVNGNYEPSVRFISKKGYE